MNHTDPVILVRDLHKYYELDDLRVHALRDIDLTLARTRVLERAPGRGLCISAQSG